MNDPWQSTKSTDTLFISKISSVEPGSGMSNGATSLMSLPTSDIENGFIKDTSADDVPSYQVAKKHKENGLPIGR